MSSSGAGVQSPGGFARGGTVFRGLQPSEARLIRAKERSERQSRRAKRGSTEAPPSEAARPREGHREVAITKKLKKVPPESPGEPLTYFFFFKCLIYLDPRTREKYKRNKMGNKPINP